MKAILFVLILFLCGCVDTPLQRFHNLEAPIMLVAEKEFDDVLLVDRNNTYVHLCKYSVGRAISTSYNVGDTLVYHKKTGNELEFKPLNK